MSERIWIAGHRGLAGQALVREAERLGHEVVVRTRAELDCRDARAVREFLCAEEPDRAIIAAGHVGGIGWNAGHQHEMLADNLAIALACLGEWSYLFPGNSDALVYLGSSCQYPRDCPQPMRPEYLLQGAAEPTNAGYALAKNTGVMLANALYNFAVIPCNLFGPGDTYDAARSHVIPALILKMHRAKVGGAESVTLWGTGTARREFLSADALAWIVFELLEKAQPDIWNVGSGHEMSIAELAGMVADVVGYRGRIEFDGDASRDGAPRKLMDSDPIASLGLLPALRMDGLLAVTYRDFLQRFGEEHG